MDLSRILAQLTHPSADVQLEGVSGARKVGPAIPPQHPDRPALLRRLGELAAYHGFGERPVERAVPPPVLVPANGTLELPAAAASHGTLAAAFAGSGSELVAVAGAGELVRWDLATRAVVRVAASAVPLTMAALAPALDRVALRGPSGPVRVCDASNAAAISNVGDGSAFTALAWAPCGRRLATGTSGGDVAVWDAGSGRCLATWWGHPAPVQALAFEPGGQLLASGGADGRVILWTAETGKRALRIAEPGDHPLGIGPATRAGSPRALAFTGGGAYLVAGLTGGGLLLWDRESGHRLWTPPAHAAPIRAVRIAHGGLSLVSAGQDGALALWDALTGEPLALLTGHASGAHALAAAPDGARVASGGPEPHILLWDLPPRGHELNDPACRRAVALYAHRALERLAPS